MGIFGKKPTYEELYEYLTSTEKVKYEDLKKDERKTKKAEKLIDKWWFSGKKEGWLLKPLVELKQSYYSAACGHFNQTERTFLGNSEEFIAIRSLPMVFEKINNQHKMFMKPQLDIASFVARSYEHGWGVQQDHNKALEIIKSLNFTGEDPNTVSYQDAAAAYQEIVGIGSKEFYEMLKKQEKNRDAAAAYEKKSSSTTPVYTNSSPAAAQDSADTAEDFEWEEFSSVGELHEKILRPELFRDPEDRYIRNSCMYLDTFIDEFREEFAGGDYAETKEIIAEILGVESGELTECIERRLDFIRGFTEKEYLLAAMYSLAYDERTDLAPYLANLACYLWTDTGDGDYFDPLLDLFRMSGEYDDDDSTWLCAILRLQENGNIDDPLKPNDDGSFDDQFAYFDDVFGDLLDKGYLPGSDGKMYLSDSDDNGGDETEESDTGDNVLLRYQNGDSYRGAAVGGVCEGFGAYFYADDGYYRGTFHQGVFHGYGIREYGNGHTYKGMWKNDTKNGYGEYTFPDGRSYFGWWKDDCFQGFGCMTLSGGEVYVGEYENHKENGIFLYNRGNKWSGYKVADGKVIGSSAGRWTAYKDGSEYCGPIIERRRGNTIYRVKEGFGEYCFPDDDSECPSDRYMGQFKDDMPYGTGIRLYTSPETDMPIIMASNDFRGDIIPRGHFQSVCGIKDPSGNCDFFLYYVGECKDSVCYGRGVMYVIGTTERSRYTPYGVKGGSIIYCDTFREHPDGPATVINRYGEELHGRFVDGMFEQYK